MLSRFGNRAVTALRRFRGETAGVTAIEFGIVGFPFLMLMAGIIVVGFMLFCSATLDYATQKAARQIMVGTTQNANLTADQFRTNVVCANLPAATFNCSNVVVNLWNIQSQPEPTPYYGFVKSDQSGLIVPPLNSSGSMFCPGTGSGYELLEVVYPMPVLLGLFSNSGQVVNNQFVLMSTATFKNEPFQGASLSATSGCS